MAEAKKTDAVRGAVSPASGTYSQKNARRFSEIEKEEEVGVYGNPLYIPYMGDVYSFLYQDYPVSIPFDGKMHFYKKTIAEEIQRKLDAAARENVSRQVVGQGDKL